MKMEVIRDIGTRTCYVCRRCLPHTSFVRDKGKSSGRTYRCHTCRDRARRANRAERMTHAQS